VHLTPVSLLSRQRPSARSAVNMPHEENLSEARQKLPKDYKRKKPRTRLPKDSKIWLIQVPNDVKLDDFEKLDARKLVESTLNVPVFCVKPNEEHYSIHAIDKYFTLKSREKEDGNEELERHIELVANHTRATRKHPKSLGVQKGFVLLGTDDSLERSDIKSKKRKHEEEPVKGTKSKQKESVDDQKEEKHKKHKEDKKSKDKK
jgi:hypothetical protein